MPPNSLIDSIVLQFQFMTGLGWGSLLWCAGKLCWQTSLKTGRTVSLGCPLWLSLIGPDLTFNCGASKESEYCVSDYLDSFLAHYKIVCSDRCINY